MGKLNRRRERRCYTVNPTKISRGSTSDFSITTKLL